VVTIAWGGLDAMKSSNTIERLGIKHVVQLRNAASGLGADITPDYFRSKGH
jgi:hypothetical protein